MTRTQALDTAANNLANAGTAGFRAQRDYFRGVLAGSIDQSAETSSQVGQSVNGYGVLGGNRIDLGQGELRTTGNPLDLALKGPGFFAIQTVSGTRYTRDGTFSRSSVGVLQTSHGEPVLDPNGKPITVPSGEIFVSPDGTISVSNGGGSAIAGKVGTFNFPDASVLNAEGDNRFSASGPRPAASSAAVQQGSVEGANVDAIHGTMQLVLVQRQAEMMQKALSVFNNDLDKTASEDLPRV